MIEAFTIAIFDSVTNDCSPFGFDHDCIGGRMEIGFVYLFEAAASTPSRRGVQAQEPHADYGFMDSV